MLLSVRGFLGGVRRLGVLGRATRAWGDCEVTGLGGGRGWASRGRDVFWEAWNIKYAWGVNLHAGPSLAYVASSRAPGMRPTSRPSPPGSRLGVGMYVRYGVFGFSVHGVSVPAP